MGVEFGLGLEIAFEPLELFRSERAEAVFLEVDDIDERDEMNAAVIK